MTRRLLAKRLLTGEVLSYDLPTKSRADLRELNGPGGVSGSILADVALARGGDGRPIVQQWSTALYVVEGTSILCGGPVTSLSDSGPERQFVAAGYTAWPQGQPYLDSYGPDDFEDPVAAYRELWRHLQSYADGALGVQIDADPTYMVLSGGDAPYSIIQTEYRDCGAEMSNILTAARIDYVENHTFTGGANEAIRPAVQLIFPRAGGNRHNDLRFVEGENVLDVGEANYGGEEFSQDITVLGQGEGYAAVDDGMVQRVYRPDGRVRRATIVADPSLTTSAQVVQRAEDEYLTRRGEHVVEEFTIQADHPNAPVDDINLGDDIVLVYTDRVTGTRVTAYLRITAIEESTDQPGVAVLRCAPSDDFVYFPATNPEPDGAPMVVMV